MRQKSNTLAFLNYPYSPTISESQMKFGMATLSCPGKQLIGRRMHPVHNGGYSEIDFHFESAAPYSNATR